MIELTWRAHLTGAEADEVQALAADVTQADGTAPLSEPVLLHVRHGDPAGSGDAARPAHLLARDHDGALVAFAHVNQPDPVADGVGELAVHPAHRRAGLGSRMVRELLDRTTATGARLRIWAHGEQPGSAALAARFGFTRARVLWQMRRSLLAPLPAPELPPGVRLRTFVVDVDEAEFLRVNNAAFDWHPEQGGWDLVDVKLREAEPWFDPAGFLLAVDAEDRLLGFHWTKVHPDGGGADGGDGRQPIGEVYVLGVDPAARGMRLGRVLTLAGLHHLRDRGLTRVLLYVEADNAAAVRLYEDLGFTVWSTDVSYLR